MTQQSVIIAIVNQKGGVGKTTTAINVASQLAQTAKVLLIDLDPQANTTSGLGFQKEDSRLSTYQLLTGASSLDKTAIKAKDGDLRVICSSADLSGLEVELVSLEKREYVLKNILEGHNYNFVIIDCPPSLGLLTVNALTAADVVLIPVQTEYYALEGLSQLLNTIQVVKRTTNANISILGVLMTMYDRRNSLSAQVRDELVKYFNDLMFKTVIPRNVRLAEAPSFGKTIYEYDKRSKGSKAYKALTQEIITRTS